jgi:hypothetical protein
VASRRPTPAQLRERRARIAAVVLGVAFLGVAVIQGPKLFKMIRGGSSSTPSLDAAEATTAADSSSTPAVTTTASQLRGFSLFTGTTPFKPIPAAPKGTTSTSTTTTTPATKAAAKPAPTAATATAPLSIPAPTTTAATPTTAPAPPVTFTVPNGVTAALVTVNGKKQLFGAGAEFPEVAPLFKLAAIAKQGLKISVLGGSFANGQHYLVLKQHNKVTLMNQSDGTKFVIVYVKKTLAQADQLTSPTATSGTTTQAAPTPPTTTR